LGIIRNSFSQSRVVCLLVHASSLASFSRCMKECRCGCCSWFRILRRRLIDDCCWQIPRIGFMYVAMAVCQSHAGHPCSQMSLLLSQNLTIVHVGATGQGHKPPKFVWVAHYMNFQKRAQTQPLTASQPPNIFGAFAAPEKFAPYKWH